VGSYAIGRGTLSAGGNSAISSTGDNFIISPAAPTDTANDASSKARTRRQDSHVGGGKELEHLATDEDPAPRIIWRFVY
jgi:hypothetical protein